MENQNIHYRTYIERELLKGKSKQEVFNETVEHYDFKIQTIAEVIRKTPTLVERKIYKIHNLVLTIGITVYIVAGLFNVFQRNAENYIALVPGLFILFLLYGLINFKYPAHLVTGILFSIISVALFVFLMLYFDWFMAIQFFFSLLFTSLAFYLSAKLNSDYVYHREKVHEDILARVDTVTFNN